MSPRRHGYRPSVELIPESLQALGELDEPVDHPSLEMLLRDTATFAERLVPGLVGVSVAFRDHGLTFTLVATDDTVATLDAVQYAFSGPCVDAIDLGQGIATPHGLLDEQRWHHFARASAARGVHSTLTLPVLDDDTVVSTVNLYGSEADTFTGKHALLADLFGAWAPGATANADLDFTTRLAARQAPTQLRDSATVDVATGILAAMGDTTADEAAAHLDDAARRAGVSVVQLARVVISLHDPA